MLENPKRMQAVARRMFKEVDEDNSGYIDHKELKKLMI